MDEDKLLEMFQRLFEKMGASVDDWSEELDKSTKGQTKQEKLIDRITKQFTKLNTDLEKGRKKIIDLGPTIKDLDQQIEDLDDGIKKSELEIERQRLASQFLTAQYKKAAGQLTLAIGDTLVKGIFKGTKTLVNDLQNNSSGIALAGDLMTQAIDSSQAGMTAVAKTGESLGAGMSQLGGKAGKFGIALSAGSAAVEYFTAGISEAAKAGIDMLVKEVEKTVKAFNDSTASGALFADGMTGMRNAAGDAGLTVEQFSGVIKANGETIASAGFGMTEGAKKIGGALKAGGDVMKKHLLNLGVGFEEQAELVAQTMKDMRGSSMGPLRATNAQIAEQTEKYAENLKIIASITGEDAKKKAEQVRQEASKLAIQQKLAAKSPEEQAKINRAMENMTDLQRKNFMDMVVFGNVINTDGAIAQATSAGLRDSVQQSYADYQAGILDDDRQRANMSRNQAQMQQDYLKQSALGLAGYAEVGGHAQSVAELIGKDLQQIRQWTPEAIKASEEAAKKQKDTTDKLTKNVTDAEVAAQDLKMSLQNELTPAIKKFAGVANQILDGVKKTLAKAGVGNPGETGRDWAKIAEGAGLAIAGVVGGIATSWTGVGGVAGGIAAEQGAQMMMSGWSDPVVNKANGGIADGPVSGYAAQLHGTEAVVPLPDGKNIPVEVKQNTMGGIDPKMMADMLHELKKGHEMTKHSMDELVRHARTTAGYSSQLVQLAS
jgi:hypothetical protein